MKKKQVLALALTCAMIFSMAAGQVVFAAQDGEGVVTEVTEDANNGTENQISDDQEKDQNEPETDGEVTDKQDKEEPSDQKETEADRQDAETQSEDVETQADEPVVDSSARTVTYNSPVDITLDANSTQSQGFIYAIGDYDKAPSNRNYTYIYNAPVTITFDGVTAEIGTLIETNKGAGFNTWRFNDKVEVNINNCNFTNFATQGMFWSVSSLFGDENAPTVQMKEKLTYNISNSTINVLVGGMLKNGSFPGTGWPPVKINSNCQIDGGLEVNISKKSNITGVFAGHVFTSNDTKESTNQTFTMSSATINVDDSTVGGIVASRAQAEKEEDRKDDLVLTGDLNVNLKNGAKLTSSLIGNKCTYGKKNAYLCGQVTGKTILTTDSDQTMAELRNVDELNLGGSLNIVPASADTGANLTLREEEKATGMDVNLTNPAQWNNGDTVLSYKYTDGTYPKVDETKVETNWSDTSMSLNYEDDTAASTQKWKFEKKVQYKVEYQYSVATGVPQPPQELLDKLPTDDTNYDEAVTWDYLDDHRDVKNKITSAVRALSGTTAEDENGVWTVSSAYSLDTTTKKEQNTTIVFIHMSYESKKATVTIREKDGSGDYGTVTVNVKKNDRISWDQIPEEVKKPGYEISGWVKEDGSAWDLDKNEVTEDITIHPVWKLESPEVTLETEGKVTEVHVGQGLKLTATATHEGPESLTYTFVWYKDGKEIKELETAGEISTQTSGDKSSMIVKEAGEYSVKVTVTDGAQTSDETECGPIAITVSDHKFDGDWEKNDTDHWHVCTVEGCEVKGDEAAHTFGNWTVTKEATATEDGSKESVCDVCGYKKTEVIPATGDSKDPSKDDPKKDPSKDPSKPGDNSGNQNNGNANNGNKNNGSGTNVQTKKAAKTGDTTGLGLAVAGMAVAAGAGVSAVAVKKRKK